MTVADIDCFAPAVPGTPCRHDIAFQMTSNIVDDTREGSVGSKSVPSVIKKKVKLLRQYRTLLEVAFDELHQAVVAEAKNPRTTYIPPHHDYPVMSLLDSGFPTFSDSGFYRDQAPRNYVDLVRPSGLIGLLGGDRKSEMSFPEGDKLSSFLQGTEVNARFSDQNTSYRDFRVRRLVDDSVERYLGLYGVDAPIDPDKRQKVLQPIIWATAFKKLDLRLMVPIALTHIEADHFALTNSSYITRIPEKIQLARARLSTLGTGAAKNVVGAATHAFVSTGWNIETDTVDDTETSLRYASGNAFDAADSFFAALRIVTGLHTGYAQILYVPKGWALKYFCDLPPIYGAAVRQYPADFDDYGWTRRGSTVTREQLADVRRVFRAVIGNKSEAMRLALKRLNGCLVRTDPADAILDGTIGLELLLGDDQNQSLSYKLRLRAGALAHALQRPEYPVKEVVAKVKKLYEARSAIVHGRRKKPSKSASPTDDFDRLSAQRLLASDTLRFVLDALLSRPEYQEPLRIDEGILLRGDD